MTFIIWVAHEIPYQILWKIPLEQLSSNPNPKLSLMMLKKNTILYQ